MFKAGESSRDSFLQQTKAAREERAHEKDREAAATLIQAYCRRWLTHKRILEDFDINFLNDGRTETNLQLKTALYMYKIIFKFLLVYKKERDQERIEKLCRDSG